MLGMGWPEIGAILVIAMMVFGPDRLPGIARQAAQTIRTMRMVVDNAKADLREQVGNDPFGLEGLDVEKTKPAVAPAEGPEDDSAEPA